jgi:heat-inducible transcriptional repressor
MAYQLSERDKSILGAIIQEYVFTGEPVGSRVVAKKYLISLSPATVRNVMADLEEMGILYQPHVSAGRIPTPEGFRCYLNDIMEVKTLARGDKSLIARQMSKAAGDVRETIREASALLSHISHNASIIILPRLETFLFKHIDFVRLDESRVLVILVSRAGMVFNRIVQGEDIAQDMLVKYANYLNESYSGLSVKEMRDLLVQEMSSEKARFDSLVRHSVSLGMTALEGVEGSPDIYIQGKESVFNSPDLANLNKLRDIVNAFEDKGRIVRILNRILEDSGVKVLLGEDMEGFGMDDFSLVASRYYRRDVPVGSLGVIGPMRMDYSRVIPLVGYMAKILSDLLEDV